ncbi:hypothetical protein K1719_034810 [Acacia pycnantha]|nr:hypothetical protein K1719_034810 [Acacia pycnantha]
MSGSSSLPLKVRAAIVTRASQGIGRAIAIHLHSLGAGVVINYASSSSQVDSLASELNNASDSSESQVGEDSEAILLIEIILILKRNMAALDEGNSGARKSGSSLVRKKARGSTNLWPLVAHCEDQQEKVHMMDILATMLGKPDHPSQVRGELVSLDILDRLPQILDKVNLVESLWPRFERKFETQFERKSKKSSSFNFAENSEKICWKS